MATDIEKASANGTIQSKKKADILDLVGGNGSWQKRIFFVFLIYNIPFAAQVLAMSFLAPNLDHWCARPPGAMNFSVEQWRNIATPLFDQRCSRYEYINFTHPLKEDDVETSKVISCESWEYDETIYTSTILSEWNLVCDREWLVSMEKSVFMLGVLISVIAIGYLSDRVGRRPAFLLSGVIVILSALIGMFSTSFVMFVVTRFFTSIGMSGCYQTCFVLLMEVVGPQLRPVYGISVCFGWCIGFVLLPAVAWMLRDWFWIYATINASCLPLLVAFWWILPESPRWMLTKGKIEEAHEILIRVAEINGMKISDTDTKLKTVLTRASDVYESGKDNGCIFDLLRLSKLRQITLNIYLIWFVNAFVYYGLSYNTNELAGNPFINFTISGAVEFPAYFLSIFAIRSLGRRNPLAATMLIGGVACLLSHLLPKEPGWMTVGVSMVGKFCITASFGIIYVYTTELFPTVVRNIGLGSASFCARVGSILAPFIRELGNATHPVVPQIVFGTLAAVSGALVLFLPETNNCTIPDTFEEAATASQRITETWKLSNGNYVIDAVSNGKAKAPEEDMTY